MIGEAKQTKEDMILEKGLDILGGILGPEQVTEEQVIEEPIEVEPEHIDHDSHFSWTHAYMFIPYSMIAVALIAGAVKIYCNKRKK